MAGRFIHEWCRLAMGPMPSELCSALLYLGGPDHDALVVSQSTIDRLKYLGILHMRFDGHICMTDYGHSVYHRLAAGGSGLEIN